jgi:hypothetical protein
MKLSIRIATFNPFNFHSSLTFIPLNLLIKYLAAIL